MKAKDKNGNTVYVSYLDDCDENEGGYYCQVYTDKWYDHEIDDFCVHPYDCDCEDLDEVEKYIAKFISDCDYPEAAVKKFVIRHYWRQWVDIVVEAHDEDEAFDIADTKYNNGDYEELPDNFENTDVQNVTDVYERNNLPY